MSSWILDVIHASLGGNKSDFSNQALTTTPRPEYLSYPHSQTPFSSVPQGFAQAPPATPQTITSGGGGDAEGKSAFGGNGGDIFVTKEIPTDSVSPPPTENLKGMAVGGNAGNIVVPPEETANIESGAGGKARVPCK